MIAYRHSLTFRAFMSRHADHPLAKEITRLTTALAAEKLKVEELELTFDLSQTAYERGTKAWQAATGKTMATPDTGDLVQFLLVKVEGLEAENKNWYVKWEEAVRVARLAVEETNTGALFTELSKCEDKVARLVDEMKEIKLRVDRHEPGASILADTVRGICELAIEEATNG